MDVRPYEEGTELGTVIIVVGDLALGYSVVEPFFFHLGVIRGFEAGS